MGPAKRIAYVYIVYYIQRRATKNHRVLCKRNATNRNANSFRDFSSSRVTFICYFFLLISFQFAMLLLCCVRPATQLIPIYWKRTLKNTFRGKTYNLLFDICWSHRCICCNVDQFGSPAIGRAFRCSVQRHVNDATNAHTHTHTQSSSKPPNRINQFDFFTLDSVERGNSRKWGP